MRDDNNHKEMLILRGEGVSDGVAFGNAFVYRAEQYVVNEEFFEPGNEDDFVQEWEDARHTAQVELDKVFSVLDNVSGEGRAILDVHKSILFDEEIEEMVETAIREEKVVPASAVSRVFDIFISIVGDSSDPLIAERAADLRDVRDRLLRILRGESSSDLSHLPENTILVANDLLPSDAAMLEKGKVAAIVNESGSATAHLAILARGYRIPTVLSVPKATVLINNGEHLIVDGHDGIVVVNPDEAIGSAYADKKSQFDKKTALENEYQDRKGLLRDGTTVHIGINIGDDREDPGYSSCDFVGLFRTEFLYMDSQQLPTEQQQFDVYRRVLELAGDKPVTLRTLDIGGDKQLPYMSLPEEMNPFLGKRALRLCFEEMDMFKTQLRAALRASVFGKLKIMFPMVASVDDVRHAKSVLEAVKKDLDDEGCPYDPHVPIGIMIEVPSIAAIADLVVTEVDFASIGTNDLCQYLCATDRDNAEIREYYQSFSPAMFRTLHSIVTAFNAAGKEISICGEMAADPLATKVLVGLGLRYLSMNSASTAKIKMELAQFTLEDAEDVASAVMFLKTQKDIVEYLSSV